MTSRDVNAGFARIGQFRTSGDGQLHFRRKVGTRSQVVRAPAARVAAFVGLVWLTGRRTKDILVLRKGDIDIGGETGNSLLIRWGDSPSVEYPVDKDTEESANKIVEYFAALPDPGRELFPGRSRKLYTVRGENRLYGCTSWVTSWLWMRGLYPTWSGTYLRLSAGLRIYLAGGMSALREKTGLRARNERGTKNPYIAYAWRTLREKEHPKPIFVEVQV